MQNPTIKMYKTIIEGKAKVKVPKESKISKDLPTFYNPVMKHNRDVTIWLLNAIANKNMQIALPLAGTGVRAVRMLKELPKSKIKIIEINDNSEEAIKTIKENLKNNDIDKERFAISQKDANQFLLEGKGYDYIDIDPFGSPNKFLDNAITRLARKGILAVTATDTACLAGTFPKTCRRKYWANPLRNEQMHEIGLRILIRKIQLIGAQNEKALTPILAYYKDHYFRAYFACEKGKLKTDKIIEQHQYFLYCTKCMTHTVSKYNCGECCGAAMEVAGPLWVGELKDKKIIGKMKEDKFVDVVRDELDTVGLYDIHKICKKYKLQIPRKEKIVDGRKVTGTHFNPTAIKTNISVKEILEIIKN